MKSKPLTRREIANLFIDTNSRIAEIHWEFRQLAAIESKRRDKELKKLGFTRTMVVR